MYYCYKTAKEPFEITDENVPSWLTKLNLSLCAYQTSINLPLMKKFGTSQYGIVKSNNVHTSLFIHCFESKFICDESIVEIAKSKSDEEIITAIYDTLIKTIINNIMPKNSMSVLYLEFVFNKGMDNEFIFCMSSSELEDRSYCNNINTVLLNLINEIY